MWWRIADFRVNRRDLASAAVGARTQKRIVEAKNEVLELLLNGCIERIHPPAQLNELYLKTSDGIAQPVHFTGKRSDILGDRPVAWGFDGLYGEPPSCLRHPFAQNVAPLSRSVALLAHYRSTGELKAIKPEDINRFVALAADEWVAGWSEAVVQEAISYRT